MSSSSARPARARSRAKWAIRASISARAGSSIRPARASPSRRSRAGTGRASPGHAGRCAKPASFPVPDPSVQLPLPGDCGSDAGIEESSSHVSVSGEVLDVEWRPRLVVLVVLIALVAIAAASGWVDEQNLLNLYW